MNEVQAAFDLLQLQHIDAALAARAAIYRRYFESLAHITGIKFYMPTEGFEWDYAYYPIDTGG